ncbi:FAD-dependent oxidoreductase [Pseudonocardia yunnanensis]|uniref:FAD-dependent oxidoreductase n=1 Tax=Pseudonocardia yunnanensis TaxID=58107 RepID=A0ABW4EYL2_9PSEU
MPPLPEPDHPAEITLPPRTAQLATSTDVLVVGGAPAGISAAMVAPEADAEAVLVERYRFLGGNAPISWDERGTGIVEALALGTPLSVTGAAAYPNSWSTGASVHAALHGGAGPAAARSGSGRV